MAMNDRLTPKCVARTAIKQMLFGMTHRVGIDRVLRRLSHRSRVFFGHRVVPDTDRSPVSAFYTQLKPQALTVTEFIRRMEWLCKKYRFVTADEFYKEGLRKKTHTRRLALLTFDDCYKDFCETIAPILSSMGIPALFFVATGAIDSRRPLWNDTIFHAFARITDRRLQLDSIDMAFDVSTLKKRARAAQQVLKTFWGLNAAGQRTLLGELNDRAKDPVKSSPTVCLSSEDLVSLGNTDGFSIGSHTHHHRALTRCTREQIVEELQCSKERLETLVGQPVLDLSYPKGLNDAGVRNVARDIGYRTGYSTGNGVTDDLYNIYRFNIGWGDYSEFCMRA